MLKRTGDTICHVDLLSTNLQLPYFVLFSNIFSDDQVMVDGEAAGDKADGGDYLEGGLTGAPYPAK